MIDPVIEEFYASMNDARALNALHNGDTVAAEAWSHLANASRILAKAVRDG